MISTEAMIRQKDDEELELFIDLMRDLVSGRDPDELAADMLRIALDEKARREQR